MKKLSLVVLFASLAFSQEHLTILHWNDFHSQNLPFQVKAKSKTTNNDTTYFVGGSATLASYLKKYGKGTSGTLALNAGDDFQGSPVSTVTKGKSQIDLMNLLNPDVMTLGNHEFDYTNISLHEKISKAVFPIVSANLLYEESNKPFAGTYVMKQIGKVKIAVVGLMTSDLPTLSLPENTKGLKVESPAETINRLVPQLKKEGADLIVALTHLGVDDDSLLALHAPDIDIIVGGHSHTALFKPKIINGVIIVQAGTRGRWLGKLDLSIDIQKDTIVASTEELIECRSADVKEDSTVKSKVLELEQLADKSLNEVIGELNGDWYRTYGGESPVGNWIADAMRAYAKSDIAFQNSGGIRKDILRGKITTRDIWEISPFGNTLIVFTVDGITLRSMLQHQLSIVDDFCQVSGLTYDFSVKDGKRILKSALISGKQIEETKKYSIVTNNYIVAQSKKYFGITLSEKALTQLNVIDRDVLIDAVKQQKVITPARDERIKQVAE